MDKEKVRKFLIIGTVSATTGVILFANYQAQLQAPNLQTDYSGKLSVPQGACDPENSNGQAENMWQVVPRGTNFKLEATEFTNQGGIVVRTGGDEIGYDELGNIVLKSGMVVYTQTVSTGSDEDGRVALAYNLCGLPEDEHVNLDASSLQRHYAQLEEKPAEVAGEPAAVVTTTPEMGGTQNENTDSDCPKGAKVTKGTPYRIYRKGNFVDSKTQTTTWRATTLVGGAAVTDKETGTRMCLTNLHSSVQPNLPLYIEKPAKKSGFVKPRTNSQGQSW